MSGHYQTADRVALVAADYDFGDSTTEVFFEPGRTSYVREVILVITEAPATDPSTITVVVEDAGDGANSVTIGTITIPASGISINDVVRVKIAQSKPSAVTPTGEHSQPSDVTMGRVDGYFTSKPGEIEVAVGRRMGFTSDGGGSAGIGNLYVVYSDVGIRPDEVDREITLALS